MIDQSTHDLPTPLRLDGEHATAAYQHKVVATISEACRLLEERPPHCDLRPEDRPLVALKVARFLAELAADLCEHPRIHGNRCRYCEAIVVER